MSIVLPVIGEVSLLVGALVGVVVLVAVAYAGMAFMMWLKTFVLRMALRHALWVGVGSLGGVGWLVEKASPGALSGLPVIGTIVEIVTGLL